MEFTDTDIAVVGLAGRFPGAGNVSEFWANLREGVESVTRYDDSDLENAGVPRDLLDKPNYIKAGCPLSEMEQFDAGFFGMNPQEARVMDPQHRHFLECAWEALEDAAQVPSKFPGRVGLFAGSGHNAYMGYNLLSNPDVMESMGFFLVRHTGNDKDFLTTRVSFLLDLRGPSVNVQTACSTSLVAVHMACQSLIAGECDMALAGGVTIEMPHRQGYLYEDGEILSPDGHCRAFDAQAAGTLFGSGVGIVVLRPLKDAMEDGDCIRAVIKGSAINNDGAMKAGYLAPSVDGQAEAIAEAIDVAGIDADTISYVEAHGTGTNLGDPIEIAALTQAFRRSTSEVGYCAIGSVKPNIGHLDTAAGVAGLIKIVSALENEELPPSLHFEQPNPECQFESSPFFVNAARREWKRNGNGPRRAGISSLGVGGTNAHVVLEEAPEARQGGSSRAFQLLALSAKSKPALDHASQRLREHLKSHAELSLADCAYTLKVGREAMKWRRTMVCGDTSEAVETLASLDKDLVHTSERNDGKASAAFMFAGGGAQHPNMGLELYQTEPVYRESVDECIEIFAKHIDTDLRACLFPEPDQLEQASAQLERPSVGLPALVLTQYAQAQLYKSWGIEPSALIGHSMGEYTAAHLAGVMSLEDTLALVALRGRLFERVPPGGMLSVALPEDELKGMLGDELSIAAVNGPNLCVASGPDEALSCLQVDLEEREIDCVKVRIAIAAHSKMLDPILEEFGRFFQTIQLAAPKLPVASNLSGDWITPEQATDPKYWVRQLRHTVRFSDGLKLLLTDPNRVLVEVGAGRTLSTLATQHPDRHGEQVVLNSLPHPKQKVSDLRYMLGALGKLWTAGLEPDWDSFYKEEDRVRTPLPTYPFEHRKYWVEPGTVNAPVGGSTRKTDLSDWTHEVSWKRRSSLGRAASEGQAGPSLVFLDPGGFGERLVERLGASRNAITLVRRGAGFGQTGTREYAVDPDSSGDFARLIAAVGAESGIPREVIYLWPLSPDRGDEAGAEALREAEVCCFRGLLNIAKALGSEDVADPLRLWVVSNNMQRVAGEAVLEPAKALLLGPTLVIPREFPNVTACSVDIGVPSLDSRQEDSLLDQLCREFDTEPTEEVIAFRGLDRWVRTIEPCPIVRDSSRIRIRQGGVYLITGGMGGIGLAIAEHLARNYKAKLVLVSRSAVPPREEWDRCETVFTEKMSKLRELEALGAEVIAVAADVADRDEIEAVVAEATRRFGHLHGVIHAAGVLDDSPIQVKDADSAAAVLRPKTHGTLALCAATEQEPLDFLALFSSVSSMAGLAGQVDYTAANAFLDAFAEYRKAQGGPFTVAIGWSVWREVGMAANLATPRPTSPVAVSHPLLDDCTRRGGLDAYRTQFETERHWVLDEHRLKNGAALIPGACFMELARAAAANSGLGAPLELKDVSFISPFFVPDGEARELYIEIEHTGGERAFSVCSRTNGDDGVAFLRDHVKGTAAASNAAPVVADLEEVRLRCAQSRKVFDDASNAHLAFGPRWSNVREVRYGLNEALMTLELAREFIVDLDEMQLHPALLDMATAGAQDLVPGFDSDRDFYVPLSYGRMRVAGGIEAKVFSHIRYKSDEAGADGIATFDVRICSPSGEILVEVDDFMMIRLDGISQLTADSQGAQSHHRPLEVESPHTASQTSPDLSNAIKPDEGMEILERALTQAGSAHILACPEDLPSLIVRLRGDSAPKPGSRRQEEEPAVDVGDIERALQKIAGIRDTAVGQHKSASGDRSLVAYYLCDAAGITASEIRRLLRKGGLKDEFVPQMFIELDELPRGAQGEIDRNSLPNPFGEVAERVAPSTETEKLIGGIWEELLGIDEVGIHDKFLEVGGHSLLALRVIARVRKELGVDLPPSEVLSGAHTLGQLAVLCDERRQPGGTIASAPPALVRVSREAYRAKPA